MSIIQIAIALLSLFDLRASTVELAYRSHFCSLRPHVIARHDDLYFVGTALTDTVKAGVGEVSPSRHGGHWGAGQSRDVYGQVVRVDIMEAGASPDLIGALEDARNEVVLVPWDYDPACEPTYWNRSSLWTAAGLEGFYVAQLRRPELWVGDRPTLDVFFADLNPYPHGAFYARGYRGTHQLRERPSLTPREYFSLHTALPDSRRTDQNGLERLVAWERANPELATRYPADEILRSMKRTRGR